MLASQGGPKAVTLVHRERWRAGWWKEARRLASLLRLGITTSAIADGLLADFEARFAAFTGEGKGSKTEKAPATPKPAE